MKKISWVIVAVGILVVVVASYLLVTQIVTRNSNERPPSGDDPSTVPITPGPITIQGQIDCLPHKGNDGVQTLECAIGLRGDDGNFYGLLELNQDDVISGKISGGARVTVSGILSTEPDSRYRVRGNITVQSITVDDAQ